MRVLPATLAGHHYDVLVPQDDDDWHEFADWVHRVTSGGYTVLGLDVETTGLDPWAADFRVTLVQVSDGEDVWVLPVSPDRVPLIKGALENVRVKVATHSQFDAVALGTLDIVVGPKVIDTLVLSRLLAPGDTAPHGLKPLVAEWLDAPELMEADERRAEFFKTEAKAHAPKDVVRSPRKTEAWGWANLDPMAPEVLVYAGLDALAVRLLAPLMTKALSRRGVPNRLVEQEMWLATVATAMRVRGIRIDRERITALLEEYETEMTEASGVITTITGLPSAMSPKRVDWLREQGVVFDPERVTSTGRPQLDKDTLPDLAARYPDGDVGTVLQCCLIMSERKNAVGNLNNFLKYADSDGYVHPEIGTLRAVTGRMSVTRPAMQTLNKMDPLLRSCFVAEPGHCLISADFAQIEIRVAAALSGDKALSEPILKGVDVHDDTAERLFGEGFSAAERQVAKGANFVSLYGGGASTLARQTGVGIDEARSVVNKWRGTYTGVARMSHALGSVDEVVNPAGRRIPVDPSRPYANLNYMIQSTARDLFVMAVERIVAMFGVEALWMFVHDEVILQVPFGYADAVTEGVGQAMSTVLYGIPVEAEAEVLGVRWGKNA